MTFMLDSTDVPTDAQLVAARDSGCVAWAGYLPSPGHPNGWAPSDFARVRAQGIAPVFIDLGTSSSSIPSLLREYGVEPGDLVVDDVEPGGARAEDEGPWRDAVHGYGARVGQYGTDATVDAAVGYDLAWRARYGTEPVPPPSTIVQWRNTHDEFGISVDRSAVGPGCFPGYQPQQETDMTPQDLDLIVKSWYLLAFKRNPQQAEVDFWVGKLRAGENGEQVLDEFFGGSEGQAFLHPAG